MFRCVVNDLVPSLAFAVGALTLAIAAVIAKAQHSYVGGLTWPFVADLSRDYPASAVFTVGLNVLAVLTALMWMLNHRRHQRFLARASLDDDAVASFSRLSYACNVVGAIGAMALPLYVLDKVATTPHWLAGSAFLTLEAMACIVNSILNYRICIAKRIELETGVFVTIKYAPRSVAIEKLTALKKAKRGFLVELACSALFVMSVVVYLPLLYQPSAPTRRLTLQECIARGLGEHYCNDTVRLDANETSLWDYEMDYAGYQVRAFAQLGCLLTLLTYTLSFVVSNNEYNEQQQSERDQQHHAAANRETPLLAGSPTYSDDANRGRRRSRSRPGSPTRRGSHVRSPSNSPPKRSSLQPPRSDATGPKGYISV